MHFDLELDSGLHPELAILYGALEDSTREWRDELEEPTADDIAWQPLPKGHSIGGLLMHIAECEHWWIQCVALGSKEELPEMAELIIDQYKGDWPPPPSQPFAWYVDLLQRVRRSTLSTLKEINDPNLVYSPDGGTHTASLRWILAHIVEHDSYHGGQAVMLKLLRGRLQEPALPPSHTP